MATEEELNNELKINEALNVRVGLKDKEVEAQQDLTNALVEQAKLLDVTKQQSSEIQSLTRSISKAAQENSTVTRGQLGTEKDLIRLKKQESELEAKLVRLTALKGQELTEDKDLQRAIEESLDAQITKTNNLITSNQNLQTLSGEIANNIGVKTFGGLQKVVKSIPGLKGLSKPFDDAAQASLEAAQANESSVTAFAKGANAFIDSAGLAIGFSSILNSLFAINKEQTEFRRLTGQSVNTVDTLNDSLITTVDFIKQASALTRQFGFNATAAFDSFNIQEAAELEVLMGLAADEAGNLALFAQSNGENLSNVNEELFNEIGQINKANKSAVSQKLIFQDVGKVSKSIALTFGGNVKLIGQAATEARILGINLAQVDKIAEGLLNIEQSIAAEFEAEVISGKQLNLEQARYFALTNDLAGLTKEIGKNQEIINSFATGTRIEQEAIAGAIGLSRDEISEMIFQQKLQAGISEEEAARAAGMSIEDAKRLSLQESINKSVSKLTEALAGPLEAFAALADNAFILYTTLGLIGTISLARTIGSLITMATSLATSAGFATATSAALTLGGSALAIVAAIALVGGAMAAFNKKTEVGDAILPASGRPMVSTKEGGIFQGTSNDDVLMGPGLASTAITPPTLPSISITPNIIREENRNTTPSIDYDQLANAIAMGAEKGTSRANITTNLDGSKVSNRIQAPLAVNTRKYSV